LFVVIVDVMRERRKKRKVMMITFITQVVVEKNKDKTKPKIL
jgi:hypothetical protein